jgi:C4-type Zn-finger protein
MGQKLYKTDIKNGICPLCGDNKLMYGSTTIINSGEILERDTICKNCLKNYIEIWKVVLNERAGFVLSHKLVGYQLVQKQEKT